MAQKAIIVIGASAGGIDALTRVLADLPSDLPAAVVIVQHRAPTRSVLVEILARRCALPVSEAREGERLSAGHVYLARADEHLTITSEGINSLTRMGTESVMSSRRSIPCSSRQRRRSVQARSVSS